MLLYALLSLAVLTLAGVAAVLVPILTHTGTGSSGQDVPDSFVAETQAEGTDGRTRSLSVQQPDGEPADLSAARPGERLVVRGSGFDADIGIYVAVCVVPEPGLRPSPCLGGVPEEPEPGDAESLVSVWITDDWAWRAFATQRYDDAEAGSFRAELTLPEAVDEGLDCHERLCAITTRSDHTAGNDRVQDMQLPIAFEVR